MTKESKLPTSVERADSGRIAQQPAEMERDGVECLHGNIMDGVLVPNYASGVGFAAV